MSSSMILKPKPWNDPEVNHEISKWKHERNPRPQYPLLEILHLWRVFRQLLLGQQQNWHQVRKLCFYLDVDYMNWVNVALEENEEVKPIARESAGTFYNADEQKLYIFGG